MAKKKPAQKARKNKSNAKRRQVQPTKRKGALRKQKTVKKSANKGTARNAGAGKTNTRKAGGKKQQRQAQAIAKRYKTKSGQVKLRDKRGRFVDSETQAAIFAVARELDKRRIKYTYDELLEIPQIADRLLVFEDKTPRELFYWNALSLIDLESKNAIVGDKTKKYIITAPDGSVTETRSREEAARLVLKYNELLQGAEELAEEEGEENPYLTIEAKFTEDVNGEVLKMEVNFSQIGGRIPADNIADYVERAEQGEKPKRKRKANTAGAGKASKNKKARAVKKRSAGRARSNSPKNAGGKQKKARND